MFLRKLWLLVLQLDQIMILPTSQAICKTVKQIAEPIIAEQIPKFKIESVEFEQLTLGGLPPTFQGLAMDFCYNLFFLIILA